MSFENGTLLPQFFLWETSYLPDLTPAQNYHELNMQLLTAESDLAGSQVQKSPSLRNRPAVTWDALCKHRYCQHRSYYLCSNTFEVDTVCILLLVAAEKHLQLRLPVASDGNSSGI